MYAIRSYYVPDYDELMRGRLKILAENKLGLPDIQEVISGIQPLPGAKDFLDWLKTEFQVIILSDTFYQFAGPLMAQLGHPTLFCHSLVVDGEGRITDYKLVITSYSIHYTKLYDSPFLPG